MNQYAKRHWTAMFVCVLPLSASAAIKAPDSAWEQLPAILKNVKLPHFPDRSFYITQFQTNNNAIRSCRHPWELNT